MRVGRKRVFRLERVTLVGYKSDVILTYRYRIKDASTAKWLERHARAVNFVWNYCGEAQNHARKWGKRWPSAFDLIKLCTGSGKELGLHSDTVIAVCRQFVASRDAKRRRPRWRGKKSLGWVPFNAARAIQVKDDAVVYLKRRYRFWNSRPIEGAIKCGSFAQDARGRWYINLQCEVEEDENHGQGEVGIDLNLKNLATCSDGEVIPNLRHYRRYEKQLAMAQRANNKKRVQAIHAKIADSRKHHLHEASTRLVRSNQRIVVGNVSSSKLVKTRMAKSVLDAGWSSFRAMLRYKAMRHGVEYIETNEAYTTQTCSACGSTSGPKGIAGLRMRSWVCQDCGAIHDRDQNSAMNILCFGAERRPPVEEILRLQAAGRR